MVDVILVEAQPWDPATGAPVDVRLAGGGSRAYTHKGHVDWRGGIASRPLITSALGFDQSGLTGGAIPQAAAIGFMPALASTRAAIARLVWTGAPITVSIGDDAAAAPVWRVLITGTVAGYALSAGSFTFTLSDLSGQLGKPLVTATFAGTGGAEGVAAAAGRVKRRSWGQVFNVEGRILDSGNDIYEIGDPSFPLQAIEAVKDRGRKGDLNLVAWAGSIDATLAALADAQPPEGGASVAPSIACVKWWTTPGGPLTADLHGEIGDGYVETVAAIADRIARAAGAPGVADLAAATALRPDPAGVHIDDSTSTGAQLLNDLLLRSSLAWRIDPAGGLTLLPVGFADPVETIRIEKVERQSVYAPIVRADVGYQRNRRVQSDSEISAAVDDEGSAYEDGTPIDALKPAEPGADKTGDHTSADTAAVQSRPAAEVLDGIDTNANSIIAQALRQDDMVVVMDARTLVDGQPVSVQFLAFRNQSTDPEKGFASAADFSGVFAKATDGTGYTMLLSNVKAGNATFADLLADLAAKVGGPGSASDATGTLADQYGEIGALAGTAQSDITEFKAAYAAPTGEGFAKALLSVDANGRVTGYSATSDGTEGVFHIIADKFIISDPDDPDTATPPFVVEDGVVKMPSIEVDTLKLNTTFVPGFDSRSDPIQGQG